MKSPGSHAASDGPAGAWSDSRRNPVLVIGGAPFMAEVETHLFEPGIPVVRISRQEAESGGPPEAGCILLEVERWNDREAAYCGRLAAAASAPVVVLVGEPENDVRAEALEAGADDVMFLPLDPRELRARIMRTIGRARQRSACIDRFGGWALTAAGELTYPDGETYPVSRLEASVMRILIRNGARTTPIDELITATRVKGRDVSLAYVRVVIHRLRSRIGSVDLSRRLIISVRDQGYLLSSLHDSAAAADGAVRDPSRLAARGRFGRSCRCGAATTYPRG